MRNIIFFLTLISGCVTGGKSFEKSRIVETMNDKDVPEWSQKEENIFQEDDNISFVSGITMTAARPEACLKASELDSKSNMVRHIKEGITSSAQLNEASAGDDPGYEGLIATLSSGSIQGAKTTGRFWQRVEESSDTGDRVLRLRCFTKVSVRKSELARQMREATNKPNANAQIHKALIDAQTSYLNGLEKTQSKDSEPAH